MDDYYHYPLHDPVQEQHHDPTFDNPFSYSVHSGEFEYDDGQYIDEVDELLDEIANSSPSPPDRSQRPGPWGLSPSASRYPQNWQAPSHTYGAPHSQSARVVNNRGRQSGFEENSYPATQPVARHYADTLGTSFPVSLSEHEYLPLSDSHRPYREGFTVMGDRSAPLEHTSAAPNTAYSDHPGPQPRRGIRLRPVSDLPDIYRGLFKFGVFNAVQSQCFDTVMGSDENMVISAPTGSGKTVLFELAIIKTLKETSGTSLKSRCVYIAPTKSLCTEKATDCEAKFGPFGAKCSELTGDTVNTGRGAWGDAKDATIIVTTGEKWDSLTRNWQDHQHILSQVKLFLIDEVHLLNETRGSTLEVVVSRMKLRGTSVRFIVVSATVPNIGDVADWIGNNSDTGPATIKEFGEDFRPCRLSKFVYGFPRRRDTNDFVFAKALDYRLYGVLQQHCNDKPVLVFCPTRKGVMYAAEHILKEYEEALGKKEVVPWTKPPRIAHTFGNKQVDKLASFGIGVHHAGLEKSDRNATEQLYLKRDLKVLFATSTLAVGVNLPAHTVVIKGVKLFQNGTSQEYSDLDVMQMIGRAGRPQFDKEGVAIIMCEQELEAKYKALAQGQTVLESSLHMGLSEHLNSEVALGTITSMDTAKEWLRSSFLYRRLQKNPAHYDIKKEGDKSWQARMDDLVTASITALDQSEMVVRDGDDDALSSTDYGDIMSKFYIRQGTMVQIMKLSEKATVREILETISCSTEFSDIKFRSGEKQVYNKLRAHIDIRYPLKKIDKPSDKVFILIQAILGAVNLSEPEYKTAESQPYTESIPILRHISRIARAVVEVANVRMAGALLKNALEVMRCLTAKAWEDRSVIFRQLDDIGLKSLKVLAENNITTFAALRKKDPGYIEMLLNRKPPFGHEVLAAVNRLPQYQVDLSEVGLSVGKDGISVTLSVECGLAQDVKAASWKKNKKQKRRDMTLVLILTSDHGFVDFRRISTSALKDVKVFEIATKLTKPSQSIVAYVTSDTYAGITVSASYKPKLESSAFPVPNTRPQDSMTRDLEGLEDVANFWDMEGDGFDEAQDTRPTDNTYKECTGSIVAGRSKEQLIADTHYEPAVASSAPSKQLANGNFECNHTCKDKTKCRHLCCRDGLSKPPPMTRKRLEAIVACDTSLPKLTVPLKADTRSTNRQDDTSKPKPKPKVRSDRPLKDLEALHERMGVKENLQLGGHTRIKLDADLTSGPPRKRKPVPNFDLSFTQIRDEKPRKAPRVEDDDLDVSDDYLPDALDLIDVAGDLESGRQGATSESTDYADPEFDALIADLPSLDSNPREESHHEHEQRPALSTGDHSLDTVSMRRPNKRRRSVSSSDNSPPRKKHGKAPADSPIEILSSPMKAPVFHPSVSDEDINRGAASRMVCPIAQSSPAASPALVPTDEDDGFVLDHSLFDVYPSTSTLTDAETRDVQASHSQSGSTVPVGSPARFVGSPHQSDSRQQSDRRTSLLERAEAEEYDPFAEFEAWLTSGAVDIVEE